jgi:hypothetical protein
MRRERIPEGVHRERLRWVIQPRALDRLPQPPLGDIPPLHGRAGLGGENGIAGLRSAPPKCGCLVLAEKIFQV